MTSLKDFFLNILQIGVEMLKIDFNTNYINNSFD